ncbi:MAG TPA: hypothetical protein QF861_15625 [Alphaproteobacteria bacterium]|jgi:hemerythrin|nr:hypothetical protein [Alphaproteobacteria bacterium]
MPLLHGNRNLVVDDAALDDDHHQLIELLNGLIGAVAAGADRLALGSRLENLISHILESDIYLGGYLLGKADR